MNIPSPRRVRSYALESPQAWLERNAVPVPESGCWLYEGTVQGGRYGKLQIAGKTIAAHRFSYELFFGKFQEKLSVCHRCDVPLCVNPKHLFLGTHAENMQDMMNKGRKKRQTHCGRGHELVWRPYRNVCLVCARANTARYKLEKRGKFGPKPRKLREIKQFCRFGHKKQARSGGRMYCAICTLMQARARRHAVSGSLAL